jgi:Holliday junction resolvase-like predicted endonuclease
MVRAAGQYLLVFGSRPPACRFDVVEVDVTTGRVRHLRDAFRPGW